MQHLWRLRTLNATSWFILSPSGLPDAKFHPGQTEDLDKEDFKVSTAVRMNNCGSSRYLNSEFGSLEVRMRWAGHVARMGEERGVHRVLVGKPEGQWPLGRPRRRWEDNIQMDVQEVGGGRGDWMELAQDRDRWRALVSTVKNLRVP
jgi:hypothetical protein